ncbi:contractile injection system tape measure protein [Chitinophaga rhizophila]|uniref:Uncharacterized protein n=1 Tax=Chitinophaga rhizophila TaxID=2866212 RepID=A0ABS7G609_9BACT|nr:contractile injection system tape measure protein [Chitinophaga rhizophila]MBW8682911.1 hypothetical protein [Chitinophaga rhizophila]
MMEQQHAIGKLIVEVQLPSREDAFSLQGRLSTRLNEELLPMMSAVLDSWVTPDTLLQIDKLEIDLGKCSMQALAETLPELVADYLRKHFETISGSPAAGMHVQRQPLTHAFFDSWLHFMQHGVLPSTTVKWEQEEWEAGILTVLATDSGALHRCGQLFTAHPYAVRRLVRQFSGSFIHNWIQAYSAGAYRQVLLLITEWQQFLFSPRFTDALRTEIGAASIPIIVLPDQQRYVEQVIEWLISDIVINARNISNSSLMEQLLRIAGGAQPLADHLFAVERVAGTGVKMPVLIHDTLAAVAGRHAKEIAVRREQFRSVYEQERRKITTADEEVRNDLPQQVPEDSAGRHDQLSDGSAAGKLDQTEGLLPAEGSAQLPLADSVPQQIDPAAGSNRDEVSSDAVSGSDQAKELGDALAVELPAGGTVYYINNAGLILLHPYLLYCFDALELRDGQQFKNEAARHKAVQLLGYMAYGEQEIPEYDLVLPKLLCGVTPATPVRRFVPLSEPEKEEANQLLNAVIGHWNALGNTSPDGLRGNFLLREGKLEWREEEWQLYVTQQAYDMLLDRLPWGFSVVGLSWMPWLIKTVWA